MKPAWVWCFVGILLLSALGLATNGTLTWSTYQVSNDGARVFRWEPSTGVGPTWVTTWDELGGVIHGYVSSWNGAWGTQTELIAPNGRPTEDLFLTYDSTRSRFVVVGIDYQSGANSNIWYTYSTNSTGASWHTPLILALNASIGDWDYPSIAVDPTGRIVVGAVKFSGNTDSGYWTVVSTDGGSTFSSPVLVGNTNSTGGARSPTDCD